MTKAPFTDLLPLLNAALGSIKKRSLIFLLSDFICEPGWERPLKLLSQRHEVIAVRLWDPRESDLPDIGSIFLEDAETGQQIYVDTHDRKFRSRFKETVIKRETELKEKFRLSHVDVLPLSTEDDLVRSILRFATLRQRRRV